MLAEAKYKPLLIVLGLILLWSLCLTSVGCWKPLDRLRCEQKTVEFKFHNIILKSYLHDSHDKERFSTIEETSAIDRELKIAEVVSCRP